MSKHFLPLEHDTNRHTGRKDKGGAKTDVRLRMTECIGAPKSRGMRFWFVGFWWRERRYAGVGRWCVGIGRFFLRQVRLRWRGRNGWVRSRKARWYSIPKSDKRQIHKYALPTTQTLQSSVHGSCYVKSSGHHTPQESGQMYSCDNFLPRLPALHNLSSKHRQRS